ncbi:hypothetical protein HDU67_005761 [Dinochytrium kinnereticum]|nr:hypothetical protein HDU67_005761 [Dinochytrium kinnereticum]
MADCKIRMDTTQTDDEDEIVKFESPLGLERPLQDEIPEIEEENTAFPSIGTRRSEVPMQIKSKTSQKQLVYIDAENEYASFRGEVT